MKAPVIEIYLFKVRLGLLNFDAGPGCRAPWDEATAPGQSTYGPPEYLKLYSESTPTEFLGCPTAVFDCWTKNAIRVHFGVSTILSPSETVTTEH
jgi:hypothetical protein